jgi:hypothetical protein
MRALALIYAAPFLNPHDGLWLGYWSLFDSWPPGGNEIGNVLWLKDAVRSVPRAP